MKNFTILLALTLAAGVTFADNLQGQPITCKGIKITMSTPETTIENNCKSEKMKNDIQVANGQNSEKVKDFTSNDGIQPEDNQLSKIKFTDDKSIVHVCYYKNNILSRCKVQTPAVSN